MLGYAQYSSDLERGNNRGRRGNGSPSRRGEGVHRTGCRAFPRFQSGLPVTNHRITCRPQTQDAPKEAAQAEAEAAKSAKYDDGAPGQDSGAETAREQIEKPHAEPKKGTLQDQEDAEPRPTDLGKAREQAKQVRLVAVNSH
jgi:hypothetical protein